MPFPTPRQELADAIAMFEGEYQDNPQDVANWVNGKMIGTMRGVTPAVLAEHRGIGVTTLTPDIMRTVTADEAADIGEDRFYYNTGLDKLEWGPATAALADFGWGSGPRQACLTAQRIAGAADDGVIGPKTIAAYKAKLDAVGWSVMTSLVLNHRTGFYHTIISRNPAWEIYRKGWMRRANWFSPDNAAWWSKWA